MVYRRRLLALAFLLCLSPLRTQAEDLSSPPPYSTADLEKYAHTGKCQLVGRAVVNTKTFGTLIFAKQKVHLLPLTDYAVWFVKRFADMSADNSKLHYPEELAQFSRDTVTDAAGNFTFDNLPLGSYIIEMFTDYEQDSSHVENRTVYSTNQDAFPTSFTTQRIKTRMLRELDVVAAQAVFTRPDEQMTTRVFTVLGTYTCCRGEI